MMDTGIAKPDDSLNVALERALIAGDLAQLKPEERVEYYLRVCKSVGLNPLTKPFEYITLNNRLTLYATRNCTDQLRELHRISLQIVSREYADGCYIVTARATTPDGRTDESIGAVSLPGEKAGDARANALMKGETKAKRRVTLSICGLGMLDETEIETIPSRSIGKPVEVSTEDIEIVAPSSISAPPPDTSTPSTPTVNTGRSGLLAVGQADVVIEYCGKAENTSFYAELRKVMPQGYSKYVERWGRAYLKQHGYIGDDGRGSLRRVEKALFPELIAAAVSYTKSFTPAQLDDALLALE